MPRRELLVSIITPKPKKCAARIEYEKISEELQAMAEYLWPNDPQPFMMPFLVVEEDTTKGNSEPESIYIEAIHYLMIRALASDVSMMEFAESLVIFCEGFGQLFKEKRISVIEARHRVGWQWLLLPLYRNSIKQRRVNKEWVSVLMSNIYEPYKRARMSYPEHTGRFVIDFAIIDKEADKFQLWAHPAKSGSKGFIIPSKGPANVKDRDVILKWCQDVILKNVNRILNNNITFSMEFDKNYGLTMKLKPLYIYGAAVLLFMQDDFNWLSKDDVALLKSKEDYGARLAKKDRRDALAVYRNWKNRPTAENKITEAEYNKLRDYSKGLLSHNLSKEQMAEKVELHLEKIRSKKSIIYWIVILRK